MSLPVNCFLIGDVRLVRRGPFVLVNVSLVNLTDRPVLVRSVQLTRDGQDFAACQPFSDRHHDLEVLYAQLYVLRGQPLGEFPMVLAPASAPDRVAVVEANRVISGGVFNGLAQGGGSFNIERQPACERRGWLCADLTACEGKYDGDWDVRCESEIL